MISRMELERLIVVGLGELRGAELRLQGALARAQGSENEFVASLEDLNTRVAGLEMLLGVLRRHDGERSRPVAA